VYNFFSLKMVTYPDRSVGESAESKRVSRVHLELGIHKTQNRLFDEIQIRLWALPKMELDWRKGNYTLVKAAGSEKTTPATSQRAVQEFHHSNQRKKPRRIYKKNQQRSTSMLQ